MPGEVDRLARHPTSFYGSRSSTNGYCTRRTSIRQRNGVTGNSSKRLLHGQTNGGNLRSNRVRSLSSNRIPAGVQKRGPEPVPRHCRYFNMQVRRRFPPQQFASTNGVNGSSNLYRTNTATVHQSNGSMALKTTLIEKAMAKSRESRVLISAELKNKADSKMKSSPVSGQKSKDKYSARDMCGSRGGSSPEKVRKSDEINKSDGSVPDKSCDKGLQLRNGRSLPERREIRLEKSFVSIAGRQSGSNEHAAKIKKRILQRSRSLTPMKSLALSRPRRSAIFTRKSVCGLVVHYFEVVVF